MSFWIRLAVVGFFTLGVGAVVLFFVSQGYVAKLDATGVTTRAGKHFPWSELREVRPRYVVRGRAILNDVTLVFASGSAGVFHQVLENGAEVLDFVRRQTGQALPVTR